jgi:AAA+ ATPase superfamily predicted ATPase
MTYRTAGPPVIGEAFFDREECLEKINAILKKGSVMLVAPRRFGKTSIMLAVRDRLIKKGVLALYLDVEWISTASDFITEIIYRLSEAKGKAFPDWVKGLPKGLLDSLKIHVQEVETPFFRVKMREDLKDEWEEKGREILKIIKKQDQVVLLIDELPLMLHNMRSKGRKLSELLGFLYWLRYIRIEAGIRIIAGGSIGIDHILADLKAVASFNDVERVFVGPFSEGDARRFIALAFKTEHLDIEQICIDKLLQILGEPIPYFIQILISSILDELRISKQHKLTPEAIERAYRQRILGVEFRPYFEHYFQRLSIYYSPTEAEIAKRLLKRLALEGEISAKKLFGLYCEIANKRDPEQFRTLMDDLENDFYVRYDGENGAYRFATGILKDLWLRRYEVLE